MFCPTHPSMICQTERIGAPSWASDAKSSDAGSESVKNQTGGLKSHRMTLFPLYCSMGLRRLHGLEHEVKRKPERKVEREAKLKVKRELKCEADS